MSHRNTVVAVFETHTKAEEAVKTLEQAGFDMKKLSIIGKGYHTDEKVIGYFNTCDRMTYWGTNGAFWGAMWAVLFGSAAFTVPGLGPMLVAGPMAAWIVSILEGAVIVGGISALGAALASIGIPQNSVIQYEGSLKAGKFLMIVDGSPDEIARAEKLLGQTGAHQVKVHMSEEPMTIDA